MEIATDIPVETERALSLLVQASRVDPTLRAAVGLVESELRRYFWETLDLADKVRYVLDHGFTWGEDGVFCFPDGQMWWASRTVSAD
jgi:hypothetical protein